MGVPLNVNNTNKADFGWVLLLRLECREHLGVGHNCRLDCRVLIPQMVDGETRALLEAGLGSRQEYRSYHGWEKKRERASTGVK